MANEVIKVGLRKPVGERFKVRHIVKQLGVGRFQAHESTLFILLLMLHAASIDCGVDEKQRCREISLEFGLSHALIEEVQLIEKSVFIYRSPQIERW